MCLRKEQLCNGFKDCADESDERAFACKDKNLKNQPAGFVFLSCDNGSYIPWNLACSAQIQPLCKDNKDMAESLCKGKCYSKFPGLENPYRWPCANGTKKCILQTSRCDGFPDCDDATELSYSSDEQNCPMVTHVGLNQTLLLSLAIVALSWILLFMLIACNGSLDEDQNLEGSDPTSSDHALPSFLLHPALSDMDSQCWSW